jgi:hypothetical protein
MVAIRIVVVASAGTAQVSTSTAVEKARAES